jgi:DNA-directed RNA polymerase specialized sigma24 family protein
MEHVARLTQRLSATDQQALVEFFALCRDRLEEAQRLHQSLNEFEPLDQKVLAMRHFERLNSSDCQRAGVTPSATSQRYYRASSD